MTNTLSVLRRARAKGELQAVVWGSRQACPVLPGVGEQGRCFGGTWVMSAPHLHTAPFEPSLCPALPLQGMFASKDVAEYEK